MMLSERSSRIVRGESGEGESVFLRDGEHIVEVVEEVEFYEDKVEDEDSEDEALEPAEVEYPRLYHQFAI